MLAGKGSTDGAFNPTAARAIKCILQDNMVVVMVQHIKEAEMEL